MNKNFKLFVFLSIFCLSVLKLPAAEEVSFPNPDLTISMDFQDASLKDVLKIFSIQAGLNFIASEAVQDRKITLFLDKVPIQQVMDKLFKANNLSYELDPDSNIFIVKDWGTPAIETVTRVFYLKYATVSSSSIKEHMATDIGTATTSTTTTGTTSTGGTTTSTSAGKWKVEDNVGITQAVKKLLSSSGDRKSVV